jgi:hypothetical protein
MLGRENRFELEAVCISHDDHIAGTFSDPPGYLQGLCNVIKVENDYRAPVSGRGPALTSGAYLGVCSPGEVSHSFM